MQIAGQDPIDESEPNWRFYCEPKCPDADPYDYSRRYVLTHLADDERRHYEWLVRYAIERGEEERLRRLAAAN